MTDLVERLRKADYAKDMPLQHEAAYEIEHLRAVIEGLWRDIVDAAELEAVIAALELEVIELQAQLSATKYQGQDK
jgi:hypothetical protein